MRSHGGEGRLGVFARLGIPRALVGGLALVVAFAYASPDDPQSSGEGSEPDKPTYSFEAEVTAYDSKTRHATVAYTQTWSGETFPGTQRCIWTFTSSDGDLITTEDELMTATQRTVQRSQEFTVEERPSSVRVSCKGPLDHGEYRISHVRVEKRSVSKESRPIWMLVFLADWNGTRKASTAACSYVVRSSDNVLVKGRLDLNTGSRAPVEREHPLHDLDEESGIPKTAEMNCRPM